MHYALLIDIEVFFAFFGIDKVQSKFRINETSQKILFAQIVEYKDIKAMIKQMLFSKVR